MGINIYIYINKTAIIDKLFHYFNTVYFKKLLGKEQALSALSPIFK
jgi:hypothetical protein